MTSKNSSPRMVRKNGTPLPATKHPNDTSGSVSTNHQGSDRSEDIQKRPVISSLRILFQLLGQFRLEYVSLILVSSILSGIEGILHPLLIKAILDEATLQGRFSRFMILLMSYLAFGLSINLVRTGTSLWSKSFDNRIVKTLSGRLLRSYYEKEYASVLQNGHGYFINRIYGDLREGLIPLLTLIQTTISQSVLLISFSLVLAYLSWKAFLFLIVLIPFSAVIGSLLGRKIRALTSIEREQEGAVLATLSKALGAFRIIRMFDLMSPTANVFDNRLGGYLSTSYQRYRVTRLFQALNDSTMVISDFLSMFVGALFVLRGELTFGGYLAFVNTFWRAVTALMQLFNRMADFHTFSTITRRVASFLSSSEKRYYSIGLSPLVQNISFSFGDNQILKNFSLQLTPGEKVVIVGPNGSGKTTLANIFSGYLAPSQGEVVLPEKISSVTLPILLPPLKVRDLISDPHLLSAFKLQDQVVLEAFADELSAGQQQKLALALALSQKADLYVIDEPLANLDPETRDTAINLMLERTREKTLVLVMHGSEEYHQLFDRVIRIEAAVPESDDRHQENSLAVSAPVFQV